MARIREHNTNAQELLKVPGRMTNLVQPDFSDFFFSAWFFFFLHWKAEETGGRSGKRNYQWGEIGLENGKLDFLCSIWELMRRRR